MPFPFESSATIGTTERSLPADTTTGVPTSQTDDGTMQIWLDLNALALGDEFEMNFYEKVGSGTTQRKVFDPIRFVGPQTSNPIYVSAAFMVRHGWDVTLKKIAGTDRAIPWSLRSP
jgi:hypothetical protein